MSLPSSTTTEVDALAPLRSAFNSLLAATEIVDLPNECLAAILNEIELQELFKLRLICHRWQETIENALFKKRRSLKLFDSVKDYVSHLEQFCVADLTHLKLNVAGNDDDLVVKKTYLNAGICSWLAICLPAVRSLVYRISDVQSAYGLLTLLAHYPQLTSLVLLVPDEMMDKIPKQPILNVIRALASLERLELFTSTDPVDCLPLTEMASILPNLKYFTYPYVDSDDLNLAVAQLPATCVHHVLLYHEPNISTKPQPSVTHLSLFTEVSNFKQQIIENFPALQYLYIETPTWISDEEETMDEFQETRCSRLGYASFKLKTLSLLAKLPQLSTLKLGAFELIHAKNSLEISLPSVRRLFFYGVAFHDCGKGCDDCSYYEDVPADLYFLFPKLEYLFAYSAYCKRLYGSEFLGCYPSSQQPEVLAGGYANDYYIEEELYGRHYG